MSKKRRSFAEVGMPSFFHMLVACCFGCTDKEAPAVTALIDRLNKGDFIAKLDALEELRKHGPNAKPAVPTLIKIMEEDKAVIPGAEAAVAQEIIRRKEDANPTIRASAALTLGGIGSDAESSIPALLANLKDKAWNVRFACADALARIGVKEKKIISAVKDAMNAEKDDTHRVGIAGGDRRFGHLSRTGVHYIDVTPCDARSLCF